MLINEAGLVRAIKYAYKHGGYTVVTEPDTIHIYTMAWYIRSDRARLPRKALAAIVEHMGMIPEENAPVAIEKDGDPQIVLQDVARNDMDRWRTGETGAEVTMVPVIMQGYQVFQEPGGGQCWGVPLSCLGILERDEAEHRSATVVGTDRMAWKNEGEAVVLGAVRKATSGWAKAWERAVWQALESVDLHKEDI